MKTKNNVLITPMYIDCMKNAMRMILQGKGQEPNPMTGDTWEIALYNMIGSIESKVKGLK